MAVIQDVEIKRKKWIMYVIYTVLGLGLIVQFFPIVWMFLGTFKTTTELTSAVPSLLPESWSFANYEEAFTKLSLWKNILNTVIMCVTIIILQTVTSTLAAYSLSKMKPRGSGFLYMLILGTQMFSTMALLFPTYILMVKWGLIGNKISWMLTSSAWAYAIVLYKSFFDNIPKDIIEAARIDGAGNFRIILNIILPLAKPVYAVCILNTFIAVYNDFLFPLMLLPDTKDWTLMMRVFALQKGSTSQTTMYVLLFVTRIPSIVFYLMAQKNIQEGISTSGIKG